MKKISLVLVGILGASVLNAGQMNQDNLNKYLNDLQEFKEFLQIPKSDDDMAKSSWVKYIFFGTIPNAFKEAITNDDDKSFDKILKKIDEIIIAGKKISFKDIQNATIIEIGEFIVDNNATNCLKILGNTNYKFDENLTQYAVDKKADEKIIEYLRSKTKK